MSPVCAKGLSQHRFQHGPIYGLAAENNEGLPSTPVQNLLEYGQVATQKPSLGRKIGAYIPRLLRPAVMAVV
jgi:hypothetical protein